MALKPNSKQMKILDTLINKHESMREFARAINEDPAAVCHWKNGKIVIHARAVISIARHFNIAPNELRPDIFPDDLKLIFKK